MRQRRELLLLVGVLLLPSIVPVGSAQATPPPLTITSVRLTSPAVLDAFTTCEVVVWFRGDPPRSITIEWTYGDGSPLIAEDPRAAYNQQQWTFDQPSQNHTFTIQFKPDERHKGGQSIIAKVRTVGQSDSASSATFTLPVFVAAPRLNLSFDTAPLLGILDEGVGFLRFRVRNDGNSNETPNVTITQDPNFNLTLLGNFSPIPPGRIATGQVLVRPLTHNESINLTASLNVESSVNRLVHAEWPMPPMRVNASLVDKNHSATLTPLPSVVQVRPHANRTVSATLTNTGEEDDVYNVTAAVSPISSGANVTLTLGGPSANRSIPLNATYPIGLKPGESVTFDLVLAYNETVGDGNATLRLNVTSQNDHLLAPRHSEPTGASASARVTPAGPEPAVVAIEGPPDTYPTDEPAFHVEVANLGLDPSEPGVVRVVAQDNLQVVARANLSVPALSPGESRAVSWSIPLADLRGQYVLAATLEPGGVDMDPADNVRAFSFYVRSPALRLDAPKEISVTPGGMLTVLGGPKSILLKNLGDKDEPFHVELSADDAAWLATSWDVSVPRGVTVTLPLNLSVPAHVGATSLVATVRAQILGHDTYRDERDVAILVAPVDAPVITLDPLPAGVARRPQTLGARIFDSVGVASAEARVARPDGGTTVLALMETSPGDWTAEYAPPEPGNYTIEMFVEGTGDAPRTSRANASWTVEPSAYGGVVPVGFRDGGVVGNTTLRFEDAQAGVTRLLIVDAGAGPQPVPYPYEVQATFWKDGRHTIHLDATGVDGAVWRGAINVTLDRTPPTLSDATVTKDAGGMLRLSVKTTNASRVVASIATPSGPLTVPMTRSSGGEYVASALAPAQWSAVTFTSTGQNGVESTVSVSAASRSPIPAPAWVVIVAAAVAALVATRRAR